MAYDNKHLEKYIEAFSVFENSLNGETKQPFYAARKEAIDYFAEHGFPTTRDEEWRFTNIAPLVQTDFSPVLAQRDDTITEAFMTSVTPRGWDGHLLVFVNGFFSERLSSVQEVEEGVVLSHLAGQMRRAPDVISEQLTRMKPASGDSFYALNTAFLKDGAFIEIPDNIVMNKPVLLLYIATDEGVPQVSSPRNVIVAGKNSKADIAEYYVSAGQNIYLTNVVSELYLSANSEVSFDKIQNESLNSFHVSSTVLNQGRDSRFRSVASTFGGRLVRNNIAARLDGTGADTVVNGLYLGHERQLIDNHTFLDHAMPHCTSHELYRGILDGKARGVFSGKIMVRPDAQKTDALQSNNCILLSEDAQIDTKPQLEIYADDVRCTHGATVGQLDEEAVFYLRSRGMSKERAENLLTYAFVEVVTEGITLPPVQSEVEKLLQKRMEEDIHFVK